MEDSQLLEPFDLPYEEITTAEENDSNGENVSGERNYELVPGQRSNTHLLVFGGKIYTRDKIGANGREYFRCRKRKECNATGYIDNGKFLPLTESGEHRQVNAKVYNGTCNYSL